MVAALNNGVIIQLIILQERSNSYEEIIIL